MPDDIILDEEAERFFRELGGIDTDLRSRLVPRTSDQMSDSLDREEEQLDIWRILLVDMVHLIGSFLSDGRLLEGALSENRTFNELFSVFSKISKRPIHDGSVLIRYRGVPKRSTLTGKIDYHVMFGDIAVDIDMVQNIVKRRGPDMAYLSGRITQAFNLFSDNRINNLYIRLPVDNSDDPEHLFACLQILSRYEAARKTNSPILFFYKGAQKFCPIMFNEMNRSDLNLTMLAGLNGLKPEFVHSLVQKVDDWMQRSADNIAPTQFVNVFSALFKIKNLKGKLIQPLIEVNNVQWLMQGRDEKEITRERIQVNRLVMDRFGESPQKAARVLNSVYGDDFKTIDTRDLGERLHLASDFLKTLDERSESEAVEQEVIGNIEMRLDVVSDDVFDDLFIDGTALKTKIGEKEKTLSDKIHSRLIKLIGFFKARSQTKKKMKSMLKGLIDFTTQDYETLSKDFDITIQAAKNLIRLLKDCFDDEGRFRRAAFEQNIPEFARYEKKVFEFLLHYLKETVSRNDRVAFLNSLQLLISRLQQPQKAMSILLDDFFQNSKSVSFSDRNSIMLSNLLLRKYNKELNLDIEITPEEVLLVKDGLARDNVAFAKDIITRNREKFFEKVRTIHKNLVAGLGSETDVQEQMPIRYLFSLEREIYIFLSLIGGVAAVSVIRSAIKDYGNPDSDVYRLPKSRQNISSLLQLLKVIIRGLGRNGISNDIPLIEDIMAKQEQFLSFSKSSVYVENIQRIMEWAGKSRKEMSRRQEY